MPRLDGSGPWGEGPFTGRGMGFCGLGSRGARTGIARAARRGAWYGMRRLAGWRRGRGAAVGRGAAMGRGVGYGRWMDPR